MLSYFRNAKQKFYLAAFLFSNLFFAKLVPDCPVTGCGICQLFKLGQNIINFLLEISIPISVLVIIYGGVMLMIAAGNPLKIARARHILWSAVIGLVIIFGSWVILNSFFHLFTGRADWPWHTITCG